MCHGASSWAGADGKASQGIYPGYTPGLGSWGWDGVGQVGQVGESVGLSIMTHVHGIQQSLRENQGGS